MGNGIGAGNVPTVFIGSEQEKRARYEAAGRFAAEINKLLPDGQKVAHVGTWTADDEAAHGLYGNRARKPADHPITHRSIRRRVHRRLQSGQ